MSKFKTALSLFAIIIAIWWIAPVSAQTTDCLFFCGGTSQVSTSLVPAMTDAAGVLACDPSYPDFCIPPPPPDLNCGAPVIAGPSQFHGRIRPIPTTLTRPRRDRLRGGRGGHANNQAWPGRDITFTATPTAMPPSPASTATPTPTRTPSGAATSGHADTNCHDSVSRLLLAPATRDRGRRVERGRADHRHHRCDGRQQQRAAATVRGSHERQHSSWWADGRRQLHDDAAGGHGRHDLHRPAGPGWPAGPGAARRRGRLRRVADVRRGRHGGAITIQR